MKLNILSEKNRTYCNFPLFCVLEMAYTCLFDVSGGWVREWGGKRTFVTLRRHSSPRA